MDEFYFSSAQPAPLRANQPGWTNVDTVAKRGQLARKQARGALFVFACIFGILFYLGYNGKPKKKEGTGHSGFW